MNAISDYPKTNGSREHQLLARIRQLTDERDTALEELEFVREMHRPDDAECLRLGLLGLTPMQSRIVHALLNAEICSRARLFQAAYADQPLKMAECDDHIVIVVICHARPRLAAIGATIETVGQTGWRIPPADKRLILDEAQRRAAE